MILNAGDKEQQTEQFVCFRYLLFVTNRTCISVNPNYGLINPPELILKNFGAQIFTLLNPFETKQW